MKINPILAKDFYKVGHVFQYPEGTSMVYSNFTPRSDHLSKNKYNGGKVVFFGLQGFIKWFLIETFNTEFFNKPKEDVLKAYKRRVDNALGPDAVTIDHIAALHDLGYLPLEIKALPEGSLVPMKIPVFTVRNTIPEFYWLTNMLETALSTESWKACTSATTAYSYRKLLEEYAEKTGSPNDFIYWQGHDFSMRGLSGMHDAASSGAGHLLSFFGTDTIPAIDYLEEYYDADSDKEMVGGSVSATEHSVMCMGSKETEIETFRRLIKDVYPSGVVSIVSDTWDYWKVITEYSKELKEDILNRTPNGIGLAKVVFRPDSGDPAKILCGYTYVDITEQGIEEEGYNFIDNLYPVPDLVKFNGKYFEYTIDYEPNWDYGQSWPTNYRVELRKEISEIEVKGSVECLWDIFGGTVNDKGYKVLNERVGLIYGDSITLERAEAILKGLEAKDFASCNVVFGIGSYTYQHVTRDTYGFAMKATYGEINGEGVELFKDPVTDSGTKKSAKGLLRVEKENGEFVLYDQQTWEQEAQGELKTVFKDGVLVKEQTLSEIRQRLIGQ